MSNSENILKDNVYNPKKKFWDNKKIFIIVLAIYIFFFTSNLWINRPLLPASQIGEKISYMDQRSYRLVSAVYDEDKKEMELVLDLENNSLDNINDYYYSLTMKRGNTKKVEIKEVYNNPLLTVIRLKNIPSRYREIEFLFAPKITKIEKITDDMTGIIRLNKNNVKVAKLKANKSEKDYLKERIESLILSLDKKIEKNNKNIKGYKDNISAIDSEKKYYNENKNFMSEDEIKSEERKIEEFEFKISEINSELEKARNRVKKYEEEKMQLKERLKLL